MDLLKIIIIPIFFIINNITSQVIVNNINLNDNVNEFEVWVIKKRFSSKESMFVNYGQKKFKPHHYDNKTQSIFNENNIRFKNGEFIKLINFLNTQGWSKKNKTVIDIGTTKGLKYLFIKNDIKKNEKK